MQTLHFTVSAQTIFSKVPDRIIIEGSRQFVFAEFALDEEWDALTVYALFENDRRWGPPVKVLLTGDTIAVPPEVLVSGRLRVGLVGLGDGGAVRLTTKRMSSAIPVYQCGGTGGEDAEEMTPELWEQTIASIGPLGALETEDKSNLVAAINEARQTGGGGSGGTSDHRKLSNRDAADQHPMSAITGLKAALDGKQPTGNYLTDKDLDDSLKEAGKAADAAAVGKRISALSEEIVTTSESKVAAHNTGETSHSDIRLLIQGLTDRLNALADSDDTTLDQLSEVVAYIKSNRSLIEAITTSKVNVADIIDNLTTNVTNKPLSAAQGVALKALIDAISIPTQLPNPNALTFTGAVTGSYDGSAPLSVEIPSGGGGGGSSQWKIIRDLTITENADRVDINTDDAGEAFSLHEIQVFAHTMSYGDTAESFTFLMNGYWGAGDPYFNSGFKSPKSSDNYYAYNHFIAIMQDGIANVFQPWKQYIINLQTGGDMFSIGDKYQAIESVSFVGKFIAGCRFVLVGRVSS